VTVADLWVLGNLAIDDLVLADGTTVPAANAPAMGAPPVPVVRLTLTSVPPTS